MAKKNLHPPKSFEEAVEELEKILVAIESGNVGLEESLVRYERGQFLIQYCRGVLAAAEKQIEEITAQPHGSPTTTPIEERHE